MKKSMMRVLRKAGKTLLNYLIEAICFAAAALVQKTLLKGFKSFGKRRTAKSGSVEEPPTDDLMNEEYEPDTNEDSETLEETDEIIDSDFTEQ
jgi:hypothetical protein